MKLERLLSKEVHMPIFEFKCSQCEEFFEVLVMGDQDKEVQCPRCESGPFERVLSATSYAMTDGGGGSSGASATTRKCSGGNCTTYEIPGHSK